MQVWVWVWVLVWVQVLVWVKVWCGCGWWCECQCGSATRCECESGKNVEVEAQVEVKVIVGVRADVKSFPQSSIQLDLWLQQLQVKRIINFYRKWQGWSEREEELATPCPVQRNTMWHNAARKENSREVFCYWYWYAALLLKSTTTRHHTTLYYTTLHCTALYCTVTYPVLPPLQQILQGKARQHTRRKRRVRRDILMF